MFLRPVHTLPRPRGPPRSFLSPACPLPAPRVPCKTTRFRGSGFLPLLPRPPPSSAAGASRRAPPPFPGSDPYAGDASSGAPSDDDDEDAALDAAVLAAVLPGEGGPPDLAAPPALDARWQDLCARAKVGYVPPGTDRRDHLMQQRVDRCGVTKHRWEAAELVLERRCAGAGAVYDPPAAGESSNDRRGRVLRLARLVAAPGAAAQAAGWDQLERRCREVGVRCSQQAVYPTAATRPGLTAKQRARGKAAVMAASDRTRKRLKKRASALERLYAADEAADDGAGSLDLAYQLHVAPRRPPGMPDDQDDSMSDSGEVALADRLGWDRGGWLCAPLAAPTP